MQLNPYLSTPLFIIIHITDKMHRVVIFVIITLIYYK
jgi:hypothetical protein